MLKTILRTGLAGAVALVLGVGASGVRAADEAKPLTKVTVGYFGNSCEGHFFVAKELGFWKEEGLDVTLIKGTPNELREQVAFGKIEATDGLLLQWVKPLSGGLDAKFTAGVHTGCIQAIVPTKSPINKIADLKGKTIGVPGIGGGPHILLARALVEAGVDPVKDVTWKSYPYAELPLVLEQGQIDAASLADPLPQAVIDSGKARKLLNQATDAPFKDEYCCFLIVNGKLIREKPEVAAAITRGVLRAAAHIVYHPEAAAKAGVEGKYVPGNIDLNGRCIATYSYRPSVDNVVPVVQTAAESLKRIEVLSPKTDSSALAKQAFAALPGVNDAYIKTLLDKEAASAGPKAAAPHAAAAISIADAAAIGSKSTCCQGK